MSPQGYPALCKQKFETVDADIDRLRKVIGRLNEHISELRRSNRMLADAIEELAQEHPVDFALALASIGHNDSSDV